MAKIVGKTVDNSGKVQAQVTPEQAAAREERVSIMLEGGDCDEETANRYCDKYPIAYGRRDITEQQDELFREV